MKKARLTKIVDKFRDIRIAVVGDLMLDVYIWGKASGYLLKLQSL